MISWDNVLNPHFAIQLYCQFYYKIYKYYISAAVHSPAKSAVSAPYASTTILTPYFLLILHTNSKTKENIYNLWQIH